MDNHSCLNCGREVTENFCSNCGQKSTVHRYSIKHFIEHDLIHGIWHVDHGVLFTIKKLFTNPGHSIREFINGKRMGYFSFVTLLILIMGISHFLGDYAKVEISDLMPEESKNAMTEVEEFSKRNPKTILLITIPIYSFFSYLWFRKAKLNLTEHFVLNSYKTIGESLIALLFLIITLFYSNIEVIKIVYSIVTLITMIYAFWFYKQFFSAYNYSKSGVIFRSLGVIFSYLFLSLIVGIVFGVMKSIQ